VCSYWPGVLQTATPLIRLMALLSPQSRKVKPFSVSFLSLFVTSLEMAACLVESSGGSAFVVKSFLLSCSKLSQ
jgi:hypothetical protein